MFAFDPADTHFEVRPSPTPEQSASSSVRALHSRNDDTELPGLQGADIQSKTDDSTIVRLQSDEVNDSLRRTSEQEGASVGSHGVPHEGSDNAKNKTPDVGQAPSGRQANAQVPPKRRRRKKKGMLPAAPAMNTIRGFTPVASGDEDSDHSPASTPGGAMQRVQKSPNAQGSPLARPCSPVSGISALKLRLMESLSLETNSSPTASPRTQTLLSSEASYSTNGSSGNLSDGEKTPMNTYEIPLEHDFVSPDVSHRPTRGALDGGLIPNEAGRKMCAADFEPLRCLGKGTYGTVLLVRHRTTGKLYAQKQLRKASVIVDKSLVMQTMTERAILESINRHPFVVKLYYAFHDHEKLYLILEYAQGGELCTHLAAERMFSEDVAAFYMAEMVLALDHLHRNMGVVYRDLKPENILLDVEGHLLLTDFGLSKVPIDENDHCTTIAGTDVYMAPEVCLGKQYGTAVDWWSFGALGFDLLTGSPPFPGNNRLKIKEKIVHGKLQMPYYLSPDAKDLLTRLLRKEPSKRLGYNRHTDVGTIKRHRFFRRIDWAALERREVEPPITPMITDPELAENFSTSFTNLAVSPIVARGGLGTLKDGTEDADPFGGFSFVASTSLLDGYESFFT
ncbi:MAG: serine/threonine protein kinase psk1 [Caeruleum heppii]|nr:MAG: serine/threonine protein kinase psk1 [Caeruleum heppii]